MILILIFPLYENSKIKLISVKNNSKNIPIATIEGGDFFLYEINLTNKGKFKKFNIFKNLYSLDNLEIEDVIKKEKYIAKKAYLKNRVLNLADFEFYSKDYNLFSKNVTYNLDTKELKGKNFFLYSKDYNASGKEFFVDKIRDIKAYDVSFEIKVNG